MADRNDRERNLNDRDLDTDEQSRRDDSDDFVTDAEMEAREANGGRPSDSSADRDRTADRDRNPDVGRE